MASFKHLLDFSDYPEEHFLHDKMNKKVPLTMTDEMQGKVLSEVVCLRSKLYSIQFEGGVKQSAKGVQKSEKNPKSRIVQGMFAEQRNSETVHDPT